MQKIELLTVVGVSDPKKDKNGIHYKVIELATPARKRVQDKDSGEIVTVRSIVRKRKTTMFEHNYLSLFNLAQEQGVEIKKLSKEDKESVDPDFAYDIKKGDQLEGKIVTREVFPYELPDRDAVMQTVRTYTTVVFGDSSDIASFEQAVRQKFRNDKHQLLDERFAAALETEGDTQEHKEVAAPIETFQEETN